jgi:hypothetical protein
MENDLDFMEVHYDISLVPTGIFSQAYCPWEHPELPNISVGAKHSGSKSFFLTSKLSAGMLRSYKFGCTFSGTIYHTK